YTLVSLLHKKRTSLSLHQRFCEYTPSYTSWLMLPAPIERKVFKSPTPDNSAVPSLPAAPAPAASADSWHPPARLSTPFGSSAPKPAACKVTSPSATAASTLSFFPRSCAPSARQHE